MIIGSYSLRKKESVRRALIVKSEELTRNVQLEISRLKIKSVPAACSTPLEERWPFQSFNVELSAKREWRAATWHW